ncbi:MAG: tetratricopeptide repeat protein, partial [Candidatus Omnitrophota bacterium]
DLRLPKLVKADEKNLDEVICLNLGFAYGLKGKIKDAIEEYEKALKYAPEDKDIHYNLGYLLAKQNKCKEAIEEYKKALTGLSDDREVYYNLSIVYAACLKDAKTADYYYNKFLRLTSVDRGNP